ncbi:hypothetical protein DL95DRAFT_472676 [Leptodontidium sp. 2 PMI_412]|nr:hypothetical protein DL95DRAFT_472676 [Leptodontidium sp. 2 PMI_412]
MPSTRASERAAAEESEGGRKSKRARKPNSNSTAAFSANQPPIARKTKRKRRDTASEPAEKDAEDMPDIPTPKPLPKKSAGKRVTPDVIDVESSPIPSRPKPRPKPEFDPSALGDEPYRVSLTFTTVLNSRRRTTIPIQHDFNDPFQATFAELRASIENNFIRPWCKERMLAQDENPIFHGLSFVTGNIKTNGQEFIIRQELDWENLITHLRLLNYTGKAVAQGEIKLDAIWKTIERDETPPPTSGAVGPKGKGKGKGRPDTVQKLRFGRSQDVESSDKEAEDDDLGLGHSESSSVAGPDEVCTKTLDYNMLEEDPTNLDNEKSRAFVPENPPDVIASGASVPVTNNSNLAESSTARDIEDVGNTQGNMVTQLRHGSQGMAVQPVAIDAEEGIWEAEALLAKWKRGRTLWYLVHWKGFPHGDNTWQKSRDIGQQLVQDFERTLKGTIWGCDYSRSE